jgi:hypothetical protein
MLCLISGANWNNGSNAGVWAANWNNARTNSNNNVGFRADSTPPRSRQRHGGEEGGDFRPWAKSSCRPLSGSASERQRGGS